MNQYTLGQMIRLRAFITTFAATTLATAMTDAVGTGALTVISTAGFPPSGALVLANPSGKIEATSESIAYTGITATTFTGITRGASGTLAAAHLAGTALWGLVDPESATVRVKPRGGAVASFTPVRDGLGVVRYDYEPTMSDVHGLRIETTNPDSAAESQIFLAFSVLTS